MEITQKKIHKLKKLMRGFSLVEIMVVVTLIALFVGLGTVYFVGQLEQGRISAARQQSYEIAKALDLYKLRMGSYPTAAEGLQVLVNPPRGAPLLDKMPRDPWGREFNYAVPGTHNPRSFDVWSNGPDGTGGPEHEVGNWEPEEATKQ